MKAVCGTMYLDEMQEVSYMRDLSAKGSQISLPSGSMLALAFFANNLFLLGKDFYFQMKVPGRSLIMISKDEAEVSFCFRLL